MLFDRLLVLKVLLNSYSNFSFYYTNWAIVCDWDNLIKFNCTACEFGVALTYTSTTNRLWSRTVSLLFLRLQTGCASAKSLRAKIGANIDSILVNWGFTDHEDDAIETVLELQDKLLEWKDT